MFPGFLLLSLVLLKAQYGVTEPAGSFAGADTSLMPAPSISPHVHFVGKPRAKRIRYGLERLNTVRVQAEVQVADPVTRQPLAGRAVVFQARSPAGPMPFKQVITDLRGRAAGDIIFSEVPPGALSIALQAWLQKENVGTEEVRLNLKNIVDLDLSIDQAWVAAPTAEQIRKSSGLSSDHTFTSVVTARLQLNLLELERNFHYSSISLYATRPALLRHRVLCCSNSVAIGTEYGLGDSQVGLNLNFRGNVFIDAAVNGHDGDVSLADSLQNFGQPRPISVSDGLDSGELNVQVAQPFGHSGRFLFTNVYGSRARPRSYANGNRIDRRDHAQAMAGVGFGNASRAVLVWGGRAHAGRTDFRQVASSRTPLQGKTATVTPERNEWLVGVSRVSLSRAPVSVSGGILLGGLGSGTAYFSASLRLNFRIF